MKTRWLNTFALFAAAINSEILKKHADRLPKIDLFPVTILAKDWGDAQQKFFSENGIFDAIYQPKAKS